MARAYIDLNSGHKIKKFQNGGGQRSLDTRPEHGRPHDDDDQGIDEVSWDFQNPYCISLARCPILLLGPSISCSSDPLPSWRVSLTSWT
ncbi:hypothetical protein D5086_013879 [Populus alba]|uniref:Uncharacterized protein n=1 Tax=Populus alba TaxID=43335 RepID=A0ACC4C853_POPAL